VPYQKDDGGFQIPQEICEKIKCMQINLSNIQDFPKNQDIIFIRNVFIYFSSETRKMILKRIAEDALADGGYIFVSMNETASIEKSMLPDCLKKCSDGNVFYFQKQGGKE
jgi:chemotaxis protein methyltransferase CheR